MDLPNFKGNEPKSIDKSVPHSHTCVQQSNTIKTQSSEQPGLWTGHNTQKYNNHIRMGENKKVAKHWGLKRIYAINMGKKFQLKCSLIGKITKSTFNSYQKICDEK